MSLSVDYITMPPKSQEVSQIQASDQARLDQENQQVAAQFEQQVEKETKTTIRRKKAENEELKNDEKKKKRQKQKQRESKKSDDEKESDKLMTQGEGGKFDIRI